MRKSSLEQLRDAKRGETKTIEVSGLEGMYHLLLSNGNPEKPPNPTQLQLLYEQEELLAYMGVAGGGKTSALCATIWMMLLFEPGYKAFIARRDYNDLKDTTMLRMEEMLERLPEGTLADRSRSAPEKWWIKPIGGDELSQLTFLGLHEKPKSYEFHGGGVDEADEVEKEIMEEMQLRARLPGRTGKTILAFNPTDEDHWIYEACTGLNAKGEAVLGGDGQPIGSIYKLIKPLVGENAHNIKPGYYEGKKRTLSPDVYERMISGNWGSTIKGTPVYGKSFKKDWHAKDLLSYNPHKELLLFHDFGYRHPFCIWAQPTVFGGLDVLWELTTENMEIHDWAPMLLAETRTRFPDAPVASYKHWGDPAAKQHKDTGSTLAILNANGIKLHFREGVQIDTGIRAVRQLLGRAVGGQPAMRIDKRCHILIRTLEKGYRYPGDKERGSARPGTPLKDGYFDHPADTIRYGVYGEFGPLGGVGNLDDQADAPDAPLVLPYSANLTTGRLPLSIAYRNSSDPFKNGRGR